MTPAKALRDAADYLEKNGWCQGRNETKDGRVCLVEALARVADPKTHLAAYDFLSTRYGGVALSRWNDAPGRTQAEVIAALREAGRE